MKIWIAALFIFTRATTSLAKDVRATLFAKDFDAPVQIVPYPGQKNKYVVVEQAGRIRILQDGKISSNDLLDIRKKVSFGGEMGLLSVAFHPQFQKNQRFFVNYTAMKPKLKTVIAEYKLGSTKETVVLEFDQPYRNHNGGLILFGADGLLYVGTGDGGSANDPQNNAQNTQTLLGKMLRLDVREEGAYRIPADNPYVKQGGRAEIYALGLRNPWRFSFDAKTNTLFVGDVGQNLWEEIDIVEKGGNYGWRVMEASHCFNPKTNCKRENLIEPIHEYARDDGVSVTGGYVYRGQKLKSLQGQYIFADFQLGNIWALDYDQSLRRKNGHKLLLKTDFLISSFGEDYDGEIFVVDYKGGIYRLEGHR